MLHSINSKRASNSHLQIFTQRSYSSVEIHLLIIKHFKEHRTKCNLKQNDICVHCHSYKLNVASKNRCFGGEGESSVEPATDPEPVLFNSEMKGLEMCS